MFRRDPKFMMLDSAMGTRIQSRKISPGAWSQYEGCNEWLNLSAPELISSIHRENVAAGADALETNTFGGAPRTLDEYGLQDKCAEINRAGVRLAREVAFEASRPVMVIGTTGPGANLPTLGQVTFAELRASYCRQLTAMLEEGVDAVLFETCQDLLQVKAGLAALDDVCGENDTRPAVYVSVTVETTGTMLVGSDPAVVAAVLGAYRIDLLGLNCATGPRAMRPHLAALAAVWPGPLMCMPNAGMPEMRGDKAVYPLRPQKFAELTAGLVREFGLHAAGGCCGTGPRHIRALQDALKDYTPPCRSGPPPEAAASNFQAVEFDRREPLYIGERGNAAGSRRFRDALLAGDDDAALECIVEQEHTPACLADLGCAYAGRDEVADLRRLSARAARETRLPLVLDSTDPEALEAALQQIGGRPVINSVNFESGEDRARRIVFLARRYGAALVGLTIDEEGMARSVERKYEIARRLVEFCGAHGLRPGDLFIDPLTFTVASGDKSLRDSARMTLEAVRRIKRDFPGVRTLLGVTNVSYGLQSAARRVLDAVFLDQAAAAGLDACIINTKRIVPPGDLDPEAVRMARALLEDDRRHGDPLDSLLRYFSRQPDEQQEDTHRLAADERVRKAVLRGRMHGLVRDLDELLEQRAGSQVLDEVLMPAMSEVGRLFNEGRLQLPFVLKSAEVMKRAVDHLRSHLDEGQAHGRGTLVLATVSGDVHDIGKNLVDIIVSNNGFKVINLGTKVPVDEMMRVVRETNADALGMSGLLVKSAAVMAENLKAMNRSGIRVPVLLGGAALTPAFVRESCVPRYEGRVAYCRDAFEGLKKLQQLTRKGGWASAPPVAEKRQPALSGGSFEVDLETPAPPPFTGARLCRDIDLNEVLPLISRKSLYYGRWRLKAGGDGGYAAALRQRIENSWIESGALQPVAAYGYFACRREDSRLRIMPPDGDPVTLKFPVRRQPPNISVAHFFRADADMLGLFAVSLGGEVDARLRTLYAADRYQEYFLQHGYAVTLAEALAEYWHRRMRAGWGFPDPVSDPGYCLRSLYRGERFSFGYPSAPDTAGNAVICRLLETEKIGLTVTGNGMLRPECSTCALVAHRAGARHFVP